MSERSDTFKIDDAASYDNLAGHFDHFTEQATQHLPPQMASLANLQPWHQVLDVGAGTGVVTLCIASKLDERGRVTGVDLAERMLRVASNKASDRGLTSRVNLTVMDAERLQLADESFDAVFSLYALRHFPDPQTAVNKMYRVLKPGGRVVVALGSRPPLLSRHGIAAIGRRVWGTVRQKTGMQLEACRFQDGLVREHMPAKKSDEAAAWTAHKQEFTGSAKNLLKKAGFLQITSRWSGQQTVIETPEDFWNLQMTFSSFSRKRLARASRSEVDALKSEFLKRSKQVLDRNGQLIYPTGAAIVAGTKTH